MDLRLENRIKVFNAGCRFVVTMVKLYKQFLHIKPSNFSGRKRMKKKVFHFQTLGSLPLSVRSQALSKVPWKKFVPCWLFCCFVRCSVIFSRFLPFLVDRMSPWHTMAYSINDVANKFMHTKTWLGKILSLTLEVTVAAIIGNQFSQISQTLNAFIHTIYCLLWTDITISMKTNYQNFETYCLQI